MIYNIYCPKGTKGLYVEPFSFFGVDVNGSGHVITAERLKKGKLIYYDAQNGSFIKIEEYADRNVEYFELLIVDNLIFNPDMLKAVSEVLQ